MRSLISKAVCLASLALLVAYAAAQQTAGSANAKVSWLPVLDKPPERLKYQAFVSKTVNREYGFLLYLPPDYAKKSSGRFPVVYWLHGRGGDPTQARAMVDRLDAAIRENRAPAMIVVGCSDPTRENMWCDSKDGKCPVETVIVGDLIAHVDSTYRTMARREARAVEGFSMGGFGAVHLGFKYPDTFAAVSVLSTAMPTATLLRDNYRDMFDRIFGGDPDYCEANMLWTLVKKNTGRIRGKTPIRIYAGALDELRGGCVEFHELLDELKITHQFGLVPNSGHNAEQIYQNFEGNPFEFYKQAFAKLEIDHWRIVNINDDGMDLKAYGTSVVNCYIQGTGATPPHSGATAN